MEAFAVVVVFFVVIAVIGWFLHLMMPGTPTPTTDLAARVSAGRPPILTRTYRGNPTDTAIAFQKEASSLAAQGYVPINQMYTPGSWGAGAFVLALVLCFLLIGLLVFLYLLIVKPDGTLSVTYRLQSGSRVASNVTTGAINDVGARGPRPARRPRPRADP